MGSPDVVFGAELGDVDACGSDVHVCVGFGFALVGSRQMAGASVTTQVQIETARRVWALSRSAARKIWLKRAPEAGYAEAVACMLYMVAAHESGGFVARRQFRFSRTSSGGAFGLWQIEEAGIVAGRLAVEASGVMRDRCLGWLYRWQGVWPATSADTLLAVQEWDGDALACLLARMYHLADRAPVPATLPEMAVYCKEHHNYGGRATPAAYLAAWKVWAPVAHPEWKVES